MVHKIYPEVAIPPTKSPAQILVAEVESIRNGKQVSTVINGYGVTVDKLEAVGEFIKIIGTNSIHLVHYTNIELTFHKNVERRIVERKRL